MMAQEHVNIPYIDDVDEGITLKVGNCKNQNMKYAVTKNETLQDDKESQTGINGSDDENIEVMEEKKPKSPSRQSTGAFCRKTNESSTVAGISCSIVRLAELERDSSCLRKRVIKTCGVSFGKISFCRDRKNEESINESKCEPTDKVIKVKGNAPDRKMSSKSKRHDSSFIFDRRNSQNHQHMKAKPRDRKLIRSLSDLGQVKFTAMKLKKHSQKDVAKKEMAKDWTKSYDMMCQRAQMLELAIETAEKDDLAVKPVNIFNTDTAGEKRKERKKNKTQGAETGSFFSIHSVSSIGTVNFEENVSNTSLEDEKDEERIEKIKETKKESKRKHFARLKSFDDTQSLDKIELAL